MANPAALPWLGFRRTDGRIGIRNCLAVISATDAANPVARRLAAAVPGAVAITPLYGRGQLGDDLALSIRTMVGLGTNPNVYAVLVVSLEPVAGARVAEAIAAAGTPVEMLSIQSLSGTPNLQARGTVLLDAWRSDAVRVARTPFVEGELSIGLECGGSDSSSGLVSNPAIGLVCDRLVDAGARLVFSEPVECLGGEAALDARAASPAVAAAIRDTILKYERIAEAAQVNLNAVNPAPDNIRGGLTTIEEKSLGAICKTGTRPISGVLSYGAPAPAPGLYLMDAPAPATENITALSAGGAHAILFGTGALNSIGSPVSPTIKICGNPRTCAAMPVHIDVPLGDVVTGETSLQAAGERIYAGLRKVACGALTAAERLGELEVAISRIRPSI
ncbi:UxaA family hydrolase [Aquabacter spiritensis]|uniref:Altronate dehydratase large subunit n=1 Tax=Aquabacter spiritensis TaxID=933073 RepID=A0A4R3LSE0_9HYPH|nr:UxaA family hydrolase [Aquabacter spiritensis]TCT01505.1 altronate dehydratase large subunit [Aquabacter spiritensis]